MNSELKTNLGPMGFTIGPALVYSLLSSHNCIYFWRKPYAILVEIFIYCLQFWPLPMDFLHKLKTNSCTSITISFKNQMFILFFYYILNIKGFLFNQHWVRREKVHRTCIIFRGSNSVVSFIDDSLYIWRRIQQIPIIFYRRIFTEWSQF